MPTPIRDRRGVRFSSLPDAEGFGRHTEGRGTSSAPERVWCNGESGDDLTNPETLSGRNHSCLFSERPESLKIRTISGRISSRSHSVSTHTHVEEFYDSVGKWSFLQLRACFSLLLHLKRYGKPEKQRLWKTIRALSPFCPPRHFSLPHQGIAQETVERHTPHSGYSAWHFSPQRPCVQIRKTLPRQGNLHPSEKSESLEKMCFQALSFSSILLAGTQL